ncbi:succinate dehydrogenase assembly factor 2 [Terrarubrum flagellatum]|uniref:FAD assembly factor SdhE n=1 Tax=Terrirubrum flagellatum TaxID=2895980 RepID=UPI0031452A2D
MSSRPTGPTLSSEALDPRRRRCLYRAWHRGTREMDLVMGPFADAHLPDLTDAELDEFEELIETPDRDLFSWLTGELPTPEAYDRPVWRRLAQFHTHLKPSNF